MRTDYSLNLTKRPRRLRKSESIRTLTQEHWLHAADLIQPLFVVDGEGSPEPVDSMPGVERLPMEYLLRECEQLQKLGVHAVALFPKLEVSLKDEDGKEALNEKTLILRAVRAVKKAFPELITIADIALDPYTTHGHDGVLNKKKTDVDNDRTVKILCQMATLHAEAGVDWVAPSDMMDGRVAAIRSALDADNFQETSILAYAAKFASAFYGPFREAVGSSPNAAEANLSKATYQLNPANSREALMEALEDEKEGADILMVKPAGAYLDIIRDIKDATELPLAAYQVSGEYAQLHAAANHGWLDLEKCREESLLAIKRAGADMILTYFAKVQAEALGG